MIWLLPPALALLIKVYFFFHLRAHKETNIFLCQNVGGNHYFILFLLSIFFMSGFELLLFLKVGHNLFVLKMYYVTSIFTLLYIFLNCLKISQTPLFINRGGLLFVASALSSLILFSDNIVAGFSVLNNNAITRIVGEYYVVFQLYSVFFIVSSVFFLIKNIFRAKEYYIRSRCLITLLAFAPLIVIVLSIMVLMQFGYRVNMAGFLSLGTCFMLLVFLSLSNKQALFKVMKFVPFSRERAYYLKLRGLLAQFSRPIMEESVDMKSLLKEIEHLVIQNAHHYFASQKEVAQALSMSESKVSRTLDSTHST